LRLSTLLGGIAVLAIQAVLGFNLQRSEYLPSPPPLSQFSNDLAGWQAVQDGVVDPDALAMLAPDDVLNREYRRKDSNQAVTLFIAYYKTRHRARNAHDPKVCLPGSGWNSMESRIVDVPVGLPYVTIPVNYLLIQRGLSKNVALYWYQTHRGPETQIQILNLDRIIETIRDNRTDMALVRIVAPVEGNDVASARAAATSYASSIYRSIEKQFPLRQ